MKTYVATALRSALFVFACVFLVIVICFTIAYRSAPDYSNTNEIRRKHAGTVVLDANGELLRIFPNNVGDFVIWAEDAETAMTALRDKLR